MSCRWHVHAQTKSIGAEHKVSWYKHSKMYFLAKKAPQLQSIENTFNICFIALLFSLSFFNWQLLQLLGDRCQVLIIVSNSYGACGHVMNRFRKCAEHWHKVRWSIVKLNRIKVYRRWTNLLLGVWKMVAGVAEDVDFQKNSTTTGCRQK